MQKALDQATVDRYHTNGIHFPVEAFSAGEAAEMLSKLEHMEARDGGRLSPRTNKKPHLLLPWIDKVIRHPKLLDVVEDVIGPDILCWSSQFFIKNAHDPSFVSWHQDATYWGLSTSEVMTAWIAFTPSTVQSGCLRVVPGTHKEQVPHLDTFDDTNMLSRGQEIAVKVNEEDVVDVVLQPGQASLHNVLLFHGSNPNNADHRRVGLAVRYIPTHVRQTAGSRDSATLVRGTDKFGYFDLAPPPEADFHPDAVARHAEIIDRQLEILYAGAAKQGKRA